MANAALAAEDQLARIVDQPAEGFSLKLPFNWEPIPQNLLHPPADMAGKHPQPSKAPWYQFGYQTAGSAPYLTYPAIFIHSEQSGRIPEGSIARLPRTKDEFEKAMQEDLRKRGLDSASPIRIAAISYDANRHVLRIRREDKEAVVLSVMFLTERGSIGFDCHATRDTFDVWTNLFDRVIDSVRIAGDYRYKPRRSDSNAFLSFWATVFDGVRRESDRAIVIGTVLGVILALILYGRRKLL